MHTSLPAGGSTAVQRHNLQKRPDAAAAAAAAAAAVARPLRPGRRVCACAAAGPEAGRGTDQGRDGSGGGGDAGNSLEDAVLLAYFAAQNNSLFAAQCFVETVLDAYTAGANVDELQTALQLKNMQQGGGLLQHQDQDLLLSWTILVMLTAQEVGLATIHTPQQQQPEPQQPEQGQEAAPGAAAAELQAAAASAAAITRSFSREVLGLLTFVKQAARLYFEEGYSVAQLQSLQATVASDPGQGQSQALRMMQQYSRLVVITLEVAAAARLPAQRALTNAASLRSPSGYTAAFGGAAPLSWTGPQQEPGEQQQLVRQQQDVAAVTASSTTSSSSSSNVTSMRDASGDCHGLLTSAALASGRGGLRAHAVRLLTAFVGAVIGCPYSLAAFVRGTLAAYEAGVPAAALHGQLDEGEFAQSGGLVPALPRPEVLVEVNQALFGRWLSMVYMAAAQLSAVFPAGGAAQPGWAWYGGEDAVQANAMAGFVAATLQRLQAEGAEAAAEAAAAPQDLDTAAPREDPLAAKIKSSSPESAQRLEDATKQLQEELRERGTLHGKEVPIMVKMHDPDLEVTSGAVRVWRQQVELVQAVYAYMCALQA